MTRQILRAKKIKWFKEQLLRISNNQVILQQMQEMLEAEYQDAQKATRGRSHQTSSVQIQSSVDSVGVLSIKTTPGENEHTA